ncbi:MAG TPA: SDR family oxidoreductase [Pirellulales bacterium]|nr:SDR family oxidoreductase [Pirellulales bacterium]
MGYHLLTGATGLLGSFMLRDALLAELPVVVTVRARNRGEARNRVEIHLQEFERQLGRTLPRPVVYAGNLSQQGLGLAVDEIDWLSAHVESVIHSAASLSFTATAEGEPWATNVAGTWNLLALCRRFGAVDFHHVSTAYVCGLRHDTVRESELTIGQQFANPYEASKVLAERMVNDAAWLRSKTIHRPSIIVGDSQTGFSSTFHGFYRPLQLSDVLARGRGQGAPRLVTMLGLRGDERKNFVPVDWVSKALLHIVQNPKHFNRVYHWTNPVPATVEMLEAAIAAAMGDGPSPADQPAPAADAQFLVGMDVYRSYLRDDPSFDRSNTESAAGHLPCPVMNTERLAFLARTAVAAGFQPPREPLVPQTVDWHALFEQRLATPTNRRQSAVTSKLNLQLTGPWGGSWHLEFGSPGTCSSREGLLSNPDGEIRLSTATLEAILDGRWSIAAAIHAGLVFIAWRRVAADAVERLFAELISAIRSQGSATARSFDPTAMYAIEPAAN